MKASDLREEFRQIIATPLIISDVDPENGNQYILFASDWIRIILIRLFDNPAGIIEVELFLPEKNNSEYTDTKDVISTMITHLHYLLGLHEYGYRIEEMEDDILWTATIEVPRVPGLEFFEVLLPPNSK